ncbi:MAG: putative ATPase of the MinD/MRP superfamily [Beijerinckiaceae bacterium]|nr:MAG: putative ATPase of the MinD/MRP superfamily [Beijerinckiaceae bacterium]
MPDKNDVLAALAHLTLPDGKTNLVQSGALSEIVIHNGKAYFSISVPAAEVGAAEPLRKVAEEAARAVPGIASALVTLTAEKAPSSPAPAANAAQKPAAGGAGATKAQVAGVKHIIAVASGKGGVGKSTTSCNLALALAGKGLRVGVLDADIYGPSMPKLFGIHGKPTLAGGRVLNPMEGYGIKVMSIGFLVDEEAAMIWRGPMVISAIQQMLREVAWGELDVLVVDMPPGTGDAQLTMAQNVPLAGAVIVSTPQDLALIDARRGVAMFRKVEVPILGVVENMSTFICPSCGTRHDIFGHGGAKSEAARIGVPFLGEVPLAMAIRERSDAGLPITVTEPDGPHAAAYRAIADKVWAILDGGGAARVAPRIVFD